MFDREVRQETIQSSEDKDHIELFTFEKYKNALQQIDAQQDEIDAQKLEIDAQQDQIDSQKLEIDAQKQDIDAQKQETALLSSKME